MQRDILWIEPWGRIDKTKQPSCARGKSTLSTAKRSPFPVWEGEFKTRQPSCARGASPFENHKTSLRLRKCNSSDPYTNFRVILALTIIVNWYTAHLPFQGKVKGHQLPLTGRLSRFACFPFAQQISGVDLPRRGRRATRWRLGLITNSRRLVVWCSNSRSAAVVL